MIVSLDIFVGGSRAILCINNAAVNPDLKPMVRSQRVFKSKGKQFLAMRYNTGLTSAHASPLYSSPVCKRSPIQVLTVLNAA
jgi:hypothetical protein